TWSQKATSGNLTTSAQQFVCVLACTSELANRWPAGIKVFDKKSFLHAITRYDLSRRRAAPSNYEGPVPIIGTLRLKL
ncbi:MAG: hypothetical protein ACKPKO_17810, partial [Candidatus Fonsibacter sp.]